MPHAALLFDRRLFGQPLPVDRALPSVWIHGEISHLECGEVLKEVAALRWRDSEVVEAGFDDHAGTRDFVPFHRDSKPRIV